MALHYFKNQSDAEGASIQPPYIGFIDGEDGKTIIFATAEGKIEHQELIVDSDKQDRRDEALNTSDKTVVGAINEVASAIKTAETSAQSALSKVQSIQSSLSNKADQSAVTQLSNTLTSVQTQFGQKDTEL